MTTRHRERLRNAKCSLLFIIFGTFSCLNFPRFSVLYYFFYSKAHCENASPTKTPPTKPSKYPGFFRDGSFFFLLFTEAALPVVEIILIAHMGHHVPRARCQIKCNLHVTFKCLFIACIFHAKNVCYLAVSMLRNKEDSMLPGVTWSPCTQFTPSPPPSPIKRNAFTLVHYLFLLIFAKGTL